MLNLKYSAAAAAFMLTGLAGFSSFAEQPQVAPVSSDIQVSQTVCTDFERAIDAITVKPDPLSPFPVHVLRLSEQLQIRDNVRKAVLRDNPLPQQQLDEISQRSTYDINQGLYLSQRKNDPQALEQARNYEKDSDVVRHLYEQTMDQIDGAIHRSCGDTLWNKLDLLTPKHP